MVGARRKSSFDWPVAYTKVKLMVERQKGEGGDKNLNTVPKH